MSIIPQLTVMILTHNEEDNIQRTLDAVGWAKHILLVDSGSTDRTLDIARQYPQVRVVTRPFDSFARQCNFGLSQIPTTWVLSMDADYVVSQELAEEIQALSPKPEEKGFRTAFLYRIYGHTLRGALYPPRTVLYRAEEARYQDEGHGHRVIVPGAIRNLREAIYHDDRKPISRWFDSQRRYAAQEANHLLTASPGDLNLQDRIRRMCCPAPALVFVYTLLFRGCLLDGWPGWFYTLQRTFYETLLAVELLGRKLRGSPGVVCDHEIHELNSTSPQNDRVL
jgi:hypothetical protein